MTIQDRLKFEVQLGGAWWDVTGDVKTAEASRGRANALAQNGPGSAAFVLHDPDRNFDPLNAAGRSGGYGFDAADLVAGARVRVSFRPDGERPWTVRWAGTVDEWSPTTFEGDGSDRNPAVVVRCRGLVGDLNRMLTPTAGELVYDKMLAAPVAAWYTFDRSNATTDGFVEDFGPYGNHATGYTDEDAGTVGFTAGSEWSSPTVYVFEDFTATTSGDLSDGNLTTDVVGGGWLGGTPSNFAYNGSGQGAECTATSQTAAVIDAGQEDVTVEVTIVLDRGTAAARWQGVTLRNTGTTASGGLTVYFDGTAADPNLVLRDGNASGTTLTTWDLSALCQTQPVDGDTVDMVVSCIGNIVTLESLAVNGGSKQAIGVGYELTGTPATNHGAGSGATRCGIASNERVASSSERFESFKVRAPSNGAARFDSWSEETSGFGNSSLLTQLSSRVVTPLSDTQRSNSNNMIVVAEVLAEAPETEQGNYTSWFLASDGRTRWDSLATSAPDGWALYLVEDRDTVTEDTTDSTNTMSLWWEQRSARTSGFTSSVEGEKGVWTEFAVGTRDDWIGHKRAVVVVRNSGGIHMHVVSLDGVTINGATSLSHSDTLSEYRMSPSDTGMDEEQTNTWLRIGSAFDFTDTDDGSEFVFWFDPVEAGVGGLDNFPDPSGFGFQGEMRSFAIACAHATEAWSDQLAALIEAEGGLVIPDTVDRITGYLDDIGFPTADFETNITSGLRYALIPVLGKSTALQRIRQLADAEQGRLVQQNGGTIRFDDFAACKARAAEDGTEPSLSDQGGTWDLPYIDASISTGRDQVINRAIVELGTADRYQATSDDTTSQTAHGVRPAVFGANRGPGALVASADADSYAAAVTSRFGTQVAQVPSVTVNPKTDGRWWDTIDQLDIGDRVNVTRQPAQTGTAVTVAQVLEGESWSWSAAADSLVFEFKFSPAAHYDGVTYP